MTHPFFARDLDAVVGTNLRQLREDAGLAVPHLAARLGMPAEDLAEVEAGRARLVPTELLAVMQRLRCDMPALFRRPTESGDPS